MFHTTDKIFQVEIYFKDNLGLCYLAKVEEHTLELSFKELQLNLQVTLTPYVNTEGSKSS